MKSQINKIFKKDPMFPFLKKQKLNRNTLVFVGYHYDVEDQIKEFDHKYIYLKNQKNALVQRDFIYCYRSSAIPSVQALFQTDEEVIGENLGPLKTRLDVLRIPEEILEKCFDENRTVEITMRNGHVFKGQLQGCGMISLFLQINSRVKIAIFRHGIYDLSYRKADPFSLPFPSPLEQLA